MEGFIVKEDFSLLERAISVKRLTFSEAQETRIKKNLENDCWKTVETTRRIGQDGTMMVKIQSEFRNGLKLFSRETSTLNKDERDQFNRLWADNWTKA